MKCKHAQRCLLSTSGPRKLAPDVAAHLETCPTCKAWQVRLQEIDRAVPRLPVPDSADAKAAVIEQFLAEPATLAFRKPWWQHGTAWQRAIVAAAAGLLLLAILGQAFRGGPAPVETVPADPILAQLLNRSLAFAKAASAQKKVETFAALAQDLENETRNLARVARAAELNTLADLYDDVIGKGLLIQADDVQPDDREKVLKPIAERLFQSSISVARLADDVPPDAKSSLKRIAAVAAKANDALRAKTAAILKENKVASDTPPPPREGQS